MIKKIFWIITTILFLVFVYFIPNEIAYPKYKWMVWIMFILIFGVLPFLIYKTIKASNLKFNEIKIRGLCALSILLVGPTFALFQDYREDETLKTNGLITDCLVVSRKKSKDDWLICCKYIVKNDEFLTFFHIDEENEYKVGDTIKLVYNKDFPRMYKIDF